MGDESMREEVRRIAEAAKASSGALGQTSAGERNAAQMCIRDRTWLARRPPRLARS